MKCDWQALINLVPIWLRNDVDKLKSEGLQEIRLRIGEKPELVTGINSMLIERKIAMEDLQFVINIASQYSPWSASTVRDGFITAAGGHRVGICGETVIRTGEITAIQTITSISIRISKELQGIAEGILPSNGSILIVGPPGSGKTTLLRDVIRSWSLLQNGAIGVVDERREIFPFSAKQCGYEKGPRTDVISGCSKAMGVEILLRTMNPSAIAVDEITARKDCEALIQAGWCGVKLLATAHAGNRNELYTRPVYQPLLKSGLFQNLIILRADKTWRLERMGL